MVERWPTDGSQHQATRRITTVKMSPPRPPPPAPPPPRPPPPSSTAGARLHPRLHGHHRPVPVAQRLQGHPRLQGHRRPVRAAYRRGAKGPGGKGPGGKGPGGKGRGGMGGPPATGWLAGGISLEGDDSD